MLSPADATYLVREVEDILGGVGCGECMMFSTKFTLVQLTEIEFHPNRIITSQIRLVLQN
jgi:hypothetical protein